MGVAATPNLGGIWPGCLDVLEPAANMSFETPSVLAVDTVVAVEGEVAGNFTGSRGPSSGGGIMSQ